MSKKGNMDKFASPWESSSKCSTLRRSIFLEQFGRNELPDEDLKRSKGTGPAQSIRAQTWLHPQSCQVCQRGCCCPAARTRLADPYCNWGLCCWATDLHYRTTVITAVISSATLSSSHRRNSCSTCRHASDVAGGAREARWLGERVHREPIACQSVAFWGDRPGMGKSKQTALRTFCLPVPLIGGAYR